MGGKSLLQSLTHAVHVVCVDDDSSTSVHSMEAGTATACVHVGIVDNIVMKDRIRYCSIFLQEGSLELFFSDTFFCTFKRTQ